MHGGQCIKYYVSLGSKCQAKMSWCGFWYWLWLLSCICRVEHYIVRYIDCGMSVVKRIDFPIFLTVSDVVSAVLKDLLSCCCCSGSAFVEIMMQCPYLLYISNIIVKNCNIKSGSADNVCVTLLALLALSNVRFPVKQNIFYPKKGRSALWSTLDYYFYCTSLGICFPLIISRSKIVDHGWFIIQQVR